tara:strand:+ start:4652 stop:5191 length:540 start_codon:yes stop_codon:yes gene_type:complete
MYDEEIELDELEDIIDYEPLLGELAYDTDTEEIQGPPRKKRKSEDVEKEGWMQKFFEEIGKERQRIKIENIEKIFNKRKYPRIFDFGPDEICRYILDFINPIHSPPTAFDRWSKNMKKRWCPICGELCYPSKSRCNICEKHLTWTCSECDESFPAISCRPRLFPPDPDDSDYSSNEDYY